ncbi:hypothetical protein GYMLUDRAFT_44540 [Collybiopsis luxurians FD-317 M1]|uniref:TLC domain-containing protein n=1 Tax=Collybiopsis luxurians FD-317 M1 TaxID=944289 RepID=A0A0D0B7W0_9AGAR|nr:hypothetical protein GYMLUDRAFT_44540 [Collybiopsis luxurians FD-317 M1]
MDIIADLKFFTRTVLGKYALDLGLTKLPEHLYTFIVSFFFFLAVHQSFAPMISEQCSESYRRMGKRGRNNWSIHVVSQVHALVVVPLALYAMNSPELNKDRAFGWDDQSGKLQAIASAYFVWDTLDAIVNYTDFGFILHGLACSIIYLLSFSPFLSYYAARCLLWETSTIFLNIHWFLDKTNRTGSMFQLVNGFFLLVTFFGIRIVHGAYISYDFFFTLYNVRNQIPTIYLFIYSIGNVVLQALNVLWFIKMIAALRKRFSSKPAAVINGNGNGRAKTLDAKE